MDGRSGDLSGTWRTDVQTSGGGSLGQELTRVGPTTGGGGGRAPAVLGARTEGRGCRFFGLRASPEDGQERPKLHARRGRLVGACVDGAEVAGDGRMGKSCVGLHVAEEKEGKRVREVRKQVVLVWDEERCEKTHWARGILREHQWRLVVTTPEKKSDFSQLKARIEARFVLGVVWSHGASIELRSSGYGALWRWCDEVWGGA